MLTRDWVTYIVVAKIMVAVLHFNSLIYPYQMIISQMNLNFLQKYVSILSLFTRTDGDC